MTDKEFKRLSRSQLIDIIYQLQLKQEELTAENEKLSKALDDKRLRVSKAGNIAEAALEIHNVMQAAQDAAAHYLEEIRMMREATEENCRRLLEKAQQDAEDILAQAKKGNRSYPSELEEIVKEFGQKQ
jgi:cell division septum initiation protein DivIVA